MRQYFQRRSTRPWGRGYVLLFGILLVACGKRGSGIAPSKPQLTSKAEISKAAIPAALDVVVNKVPHGDSLAYIDGDDVFVPTKILEGAGLPELNGTQVIQDGVSYYSLNSLLDTLSFEVDEAALILRIDVAPDRFKTTSLRLTRSKAPEEIQHIESSSAFINYSLRSNNFQAIDGFTEAGLSIKGALLSSTATFPFQETPIRGLSSLTVDDRSKLRRYGVGDSFAVGGRLGSGGALLAGLSVARNFDIDPYFQTGLSLDRSGIATVPSQAEVYVDGRLTGRFEVPPGPFTIRDLPVTTGAGNTKIVIRDALGRETEISSSYYQPSGLLAPGVSQYNYAVGFQRERLATESWQYGDAAFVGHQRWGLTNRVTAGLSSELTWGLASGGGSLQLGLPFGQLEVAAAASIDDVDMGLASSAAFSHKNRWFGVGVFGRVLQQSYSTLSEKNDQRRVLDLGTSLGAPIGKRIALGAQANVAQTADQVTTHRFALSAATRVTRSLGLTATLVDSQTRDEPRRYEALLSLNWQVGKKTSGSLTHEQQEEENASTAQIARSVPYGSGVGYRVLGQRLAERSRGYGRVDAQSAYGKYNAVVDASGMDSAHASLGTSGGIVFIGGRVFATRPVQDGFALVRVPQVNKVRIQLNNHEVGRTNASGDFLIPYLRSYYGNRISLADLDVPLHYYLTHTEQIIAPPYRGGAIIEFPIEELHVVRGKIVLDAEQSNKAAYGEINVDIDGSTYSSPIGADGEFELNGLTPGLRIGNVRYAGGECRTELKITKSTEPIVNLGNQVCTQLSDSRQTP